MEQSPEKEKTLLLEKGLPGTLGPGWGESWLHTPFTAWGMAQPGQGRFHLTRKGSAQPLPAEQVAVALPLVASGIGEHMQILSVLH